ncbi:MAG: 1,4-alpha-glucan branching protein domain-containing protein [Verrucomicrobiae bacterium]|nr:1,4-alpha-glucan branching protein domain-containing protein [Verrucomicrobiae bacterium]
MPKGYLAIVLHAHLPFVRHPEHEEFLEEDWLYEAITETYIPLINMMDGLVHDGVDFRLTMSVTPPLASMLLDPLLQERYVRHINRLLELTWKETKRYQYEPAFKDLAWFYHNRYLEARHVFQEKYGRNLVGAFRKFQEMGRLEIITCGATHGFLPLMRENPEAVRAQILLARDHYESCFGCTPRGIWLPECAYFPGVEKFLQEAEIRYFIMDTHGVMFAEPRPRYGIYAPVFTRSGPAAFARDPESGQQVWSSQAGYPGDPVYRDFYRDIGFDAELDYIRPYIQPNGLRKFTGVKYFKITGPGHDKQPYLRQEAVERAATHAGNFMFNREKQVEHLAGVMGGDQKPIIVSPYDAELFGHWWFEGPDFLNYFIRKSAFDQEVFRLTHAVDYLREYDTHQVVTPSASSWGNKGYWEVWLDSCNSWVYPHLHVAAQRMTEAARKYPGAYGQMERALKQLARELLLAQSSDWAFLMKTGTAPHYATKRTRDHILRFTKLFEQVRDNRIDERFLAGLEHRDNIFPDLNWKHYL